MPRPCDTPYFPYLSAPHYAQRPPADRSLEVEVDGWDYYVECLVTETPGGTMLLEITCTALVWVRPGNPGEVREVPFVAGGRLREGIEKAVGEWLELEGS